MTDIVDPATRSRIMASIRGRNTKPELLVRSCLHRSGVRFRLHVRDLPGRPDLVFSKYRVALFVHGCFWHRHNSCRYAYTPSANSQKWLAKFEANVERDRRQIDLLRQSGWRVFVIWECALRAESLYELLAELITELRTGESTYREWPVQPEKSTR